MTRDWQRALSEFIAAFPQRRDVTAAVACGSFVTGSPSPRSDIDVHLILKDGTRWRERGNKIVRGILIEYFANPPAQIRRYFADDHKDNRCANMTQFVIGRIIFDDHGIGKILQKEARRWLRKRFKPRPDARHEIDKYAIWDHHDNLTDAFEQRAANFEYLYYNWLTLVYDLYARHWRQPVATEKNTLAILTSAAAR
jgi:predicted nucleotidyltransferase